MGKKRNFDEFIELTKQGPDEWEILGSKEGKADQEAEPQETRRIVDVKYVLDDIKPAGEEAEPQERTSKAPKKRNKIVTSLTLEPKLYKDIQDYCKSHGVNFSNTTALIWSKYLEKEKASIVRSIIPLE